MFEGFGVRGGKQSWQETESGLVRGGVAKEPWFIAAGAEV